MTKPCSIVETAGLIEEGFNKPASRQSSIKHSPTLRVLSVLPVIAMITMSGRYCYKHQNLQLPMDVSLW